MSTMCLLNALSTPYVIIVKFIFYVDMLQISSAFICSKKHEFYILSFGILSFIFLCSFNFCYDVLDSKKILYNGQFGFRSIHSTSPAVHHLLSFVHDVLENNIVPLTVFLEFRKDFDTVDFNTLLSRLSWLGLGSTCVKWFSSYLLGRLSKLLYQIY